MSDTDEERDPNSPQDREHFGEASLGDAQSESDPDPLDERGDVYAENDEEKLSDVPALEPAPGDATLIEEEELAAEEAGAIGGVSGEEALPESQRPLAESGEGEAEGFEQSEEALIQSASHGDPSGNPLGDRFTAEDSASEGVASYGEADHVEVSEDDNDGDED